MPSLLLRVAVIFLCLLTTSAGAIEISEPRWGFDGKIRQQRFNLLTITVDNPTPQAVEFDLELRKSLGGGFIDAPLVEHVFLAPGTRRTVQFYPFVTDDWGSWRLSWGRESVEIMQPPRPSRRNARVLLDSMDVLGDARGSMRRFPEHQFPASVTGTDTLQAVLLDHAPNWDEARRTAFLDWIYRGGAVYVLQGSNGKYPEFPAALSQLNAPLDSVNFGSGVIRKVSRTRSQLNREEARNLWRLLPNQFATETAVQVVGMTANPNAQDDDDDEETNRRFNYSDGGRSINSRSFLDELKKMTRPEHNWLLLHFMFWVYILLIFPGCFLIGKQRNDFRVVYLTLIAIVAVFSLAFGIVGQRGYGEATRIDSVAIVSPLPDGQLDVAQWSNAFVTGGAYYDIRHKGTGTLYSTCQETEAVNGVIKNGAEAIFRVDIPPFSSREFAHRIKVAGTLPPVRIEHCSASESSLKELTLAIDNSFPATDEMYVLYRDQFYNLVREQNRLIKRNGVGTVPGFLRVEQDQNYFSPFGGYGEPERTPERRYRDLFSALATRALDIRSLADAQAVRWSPDSVRLMYYADLLPELTVQNPRFPLKDQKGKALYCVTLPLEGIVNQKAEENAK